MMDGRFRRGLSYFYWGSSRDTGFRGIGNLRLSGFPHSGNRDLTAPEICDELRGGSVDPNRIVPVGARESGPFADRGREPDDEESRVSTQARSRSPERRLIHAVAVFGGGIRSRLGSFRS